ncbi:MAG: hypothetical protein MUF51_06650 [Vicinamibacteria bacterium]|jgi:hypothetical protein|nr:hypothetical protein [Vicinamibacteria bacterium]
MTRLRRSYPMIALFLILTFTAASCNQEKTTSPSGTLTDEQRQVIARQVILTALVGVLGTALTNSGKTFEPASVAVTLPGSWPVNNCNQSCNSSTCNVSCPLSVSYPCPISGTTASSGTLTGTVNASLSGQASLYAEQTYANCSPVADLVVNGDPKTTTTGVVVFQNGKLSGTQTIKLEGRIRYVSGGVSGSCDVLLNGTYWMSSMSGTVTGTICDLPVNMPI